MPTLVTRKRKLKHQLASALVRKLGNAMLAELERSDAELSVLLTDDAEIHELNLLHRHKDKPTDVLAFPMDEAETEPSGLLGDVVISLDTAARQARARARDLASEVRFLLAHGVLHLIGFDHATPREKKEMVAMTRSLVRAAPLPPLPQAASRRALNAGQEAQVGSPRARGIIAKPKRLLVKSKRKISTGRKTA